MTNRKPTNDEVYDVILKFLDKEKRNVEEAIAAIKRCALDGMF